MAEYLLGLLLVAQSSRDRHVFRYPPDPTSPSDRLSQPIYSRATYTAQDNTVDRAVPARLFSSREGSRGSGGRSRGLGGLSAGGLSGFSGGLEEGSLARSAPSGRSGSMHSHQTEYGTPVESSGSSSDDSDIDAMWGAPKLTTAHAHAHAHHSHGAHAHHPSHPRRYSSESEGRSGLANSITKGFTEINPNLDRRGSVISTETVKKKHSTSLEQQYNYSMGYPLEFLSDLLSPPRAACNRKFEISVDELIFIGHPVCSGPDGKWAYPSGDSDDEEDSRLRGRRKEAGPLRALAEHPDRADETPARNGRKDEAELSMFHLVLILDKPDPKPDQPLGDCLDIIYREVAFKWAAAAFALQVRDNWVARQVKQLMGIRERAMADGIPVNECLRQCIERSELAHGLHELFGALHKIKSRPLNGHFSHVSTTMKVPVGSIPITLVVPPKTTDVEALMALESDSDSDSDLDGWEFAGPDGALIAKQPGFRVEPWKTLLLLDDEAPRPRRAHGRESKQAEEEDLVDQLVANCDVSKPLHEIAHLMRCDLEGVVIPLARELVQNKRAVFIDVVNIRLRTILMPATIVDHL